MALDPEERQAIVTEMQQILYADTPEIVLWYPNSFEAWRSDRWQGLLRWPEPDGAAFWGNPYSMLALEPATTRPPVVTDSGMPGRSGSDVVAVAAVVGVTILARRRRPATATTPETDR